MSDPALIIFGKNALAANIRKCGKKSNGMTSVHGFHDVFLDLFRFVRLIGQTMFGLSTTKTVRQRVRTSFRR